LWHGHSVVHALGGVVAGLLVQLLLQLLIMRYRIMSQNSKGGDLVGEANSSR
jgi:hypothetical protein